MKNLLLITLLLLIQSVWGQELKKVFDNIIHVRIQISEDWKMDKKDMNSFSINGKIPENMGVYRYEKTEDDLKKLFNEEFNVFKSKSKYNIIAEGVDTINDQAMMWFEIEITNLNIDFHQKLYFTKHDGYFYSILLSSSKNRHEKYMPQLQAILKTIEFY